MKKKIITLLISTFLIFTNVFSSFANPLVIAPVSISYNSLMALMGIGIAFGVAAPKTDEEYWDYTKSLRDHLNLVDEKYLERLDKIVGEWKTNNNNKPDDEKEPLKVPFIPNLDKLFENVGNDVSKSYKYVNTLLNPIPVRPSSSNIDSFGETVPLTPIKQGGDILVFNYYDSEGKMGEIYIKSYKSGSSNYIAYSWDGSFSENLSSNWGSSVVKAVSLLASNNWGKSNQLTLLIQYETNYGAVKYSDSMVNKTILLGKSNSNPSISYNPTKPNIENDEFVLPYLPQLEVPSIETLPNYQEGLNPPFNVTQSTDTETPPGTDTETPPGTDTDTQFPSFPSFGDSLDFSPMYLTNVTEKFPFSLPWDISRLIEKFDVEPVPPVFEVPILSETITLDLTEFSELASIVRFFVLIGFVLSLIFISTKLKG